MHRRVANRLCHLRRSTRPTQESIRHDRFRFLTSHDPYDRLGDLCCAKNYVAYRGGREGASGCLRADRGLWGRRRFRSLSRQRNIISAGLTSRPSRCGPTMSRSTRLTCMSRPARNSSDTCAIALGPRIAKPGRCRTSHAARVARERSTGPKICCAGKPRSHCNGATFARGQHSSARNIGRHMLRATYGDVALLRGDSRRAIAFVALR